MIPFFVAETFYKNPCANIDPDSWAWILSGCFLFGSSALPMGLSAVAAMLIAAGYQAWLRR